MHQQCFTVAGGEVNSFERRKFQLSQPAHVGRKGLQRRTIRVGHCNRPICKLLGPELKLAQSGAFTARSEMDGIIYTFHCVKVKEMSFGLLRTFNRAASVGPYLQGCGTNADFSYNFETI
jgi:hypothetical protein